MPAARCARGATTASLPTSCVHSSRASGPTNSRGCTSRPRAGTSRTAGPCPRSTMPSKAATIRTRSRCSTATPNSSSNRAACACWRAGSRPFPSISCASIRSCSSSRCGPPASRTARGTPCGCSNSRAASTAPFPRCAPTPTRSFRCCWPWKTSTTPPTRPAAKASRACPPGWPLPRACCSTRWPTSSRCAATSARRSACSRPRGASRATAPSTACTPSRSRACSTSPKAG
ncbi:hypothetical protein D9M68_557500 [compost metagenome]